MDGWMAEAEVNTSSPPPPFPPLGSITYSTIQTHLECNELMSSRKSHAQERTLESLSRGRQALGAPHQLQTQLRQVTKGQYGLTTLPQHQSTTAHSTAQLIASHKLTSQLLIYQSSAVHSTMLILKDW